MTLKWLRKLSIEQNLQWDCSFSTLLLCAVESNGKPLVSLGGNCFAESSREGHFVGDAGIKRC